MRKIALLLLVIVAAQPADLPEIKTIQATETQKKLIPSLKTLASQAVISRMRLLLDKKHDHKQHALMQEYAKKSELLPDEVQEFLKKKLARHGMDILTSIHHDKPILLRHENFTTSPDGTLLLYESNNRMNQFFLRNLGTGEERELQHALVSGCGPAGEMLDVKPFITTNNTVLLYANHCDNSFIFKYNSQTNSLDMKRLPYNIRKLVWASQDLGRLLTEDFDASMEEYDEDCILFDTHNNKQTKMIGRVLYKDDNYIVTTPDYNRFLCYTTHDGTLYLSGDEKIDSVVINYPNLICMKNLSNNKDTLIKIWDLPAKQPVRNIIFPEDLNYSLFIKDNRLEVVSGCTFYGIDPESGQYKKRKLSGNNDERGRSTPNSSLIITRVNRDNTVHPIFWLPSSCYVPTLVTRTLTIPLVQYSAIVSEKTINADFTVIAGQNKEDFNFFVCTTPLHTLANNSISELFGKLLELDKK